MAAERFRKLVFFSVAIGLAVFSKLDADWSTFFSTPAGDFGGKVVWITGASSGIGASLAKDLCRKGARVVLSARRLDKLNEVASSCAGSAYEPFVLPLDVTDLDAQKNAFDTVLKKFGRLDSVVLNAGTL
jgi:NADP-dependent 3-hydroxy acid dehydrogenase YdfG